ncbi:N-((2S)-2-amino-2-carboxyethyl)-L-glutamate dehydrogenase [Paenibacillus allorhizoplanae]|uniref:N-((2S)-2-amino-2-carboxyethyl)-L-glutamate dehydrogenase n=1 Tax=Paenibacillus allorhizoplanae TaxID=2905648 RepID=A0ABN8GE35_9BACL|nr:2,3-diaminopropionate biosynthesis protein SbnB [Paenibacillus allorhizoplanae]CAH1206580.1 N-((2S)-2-amino-2-carboxyethyl)-L-glutamate dehydrogenase [Paenibacillus allorhizoplanae]
MLYLQDDHIREIGIDWKKLTDIIQDVIAIQDSGDCAHPLKPYLRFRDPKNRIIAMPAYVGGNINISGIKWIASFPDNRLKGLPRANNTLILNKPSTGEPLAFIHSGLLNGLRTAAVSGVMLSQFVMVRQPERLRIHLIGWGPIGRLHLDMCAALFGEWIEEVRIYDLNGVEFETVPAAIQSRTQVINDWRMGYREANVIMTCTVSAERYIDETPPRGALLLNVSLRDYKAESVADVKAIIVDDWREVCREQTDIEQLHLLNNLQESDVHTLADVVLRDQLAKVEVHEPVFFNPMGLGIFDIAVAGYYWREALRLQKGITLEGSKYK